MPALWRARSAARWTRRSARGAVLVSTARRALTAGIAVLALGAPEAATAQETTRLMVRAVAKDAKVIGSGVGGAHITVRDVATGEVLVEGVQEGSTGSTEAIMLTPRLRGLTSYGVDPEAAGFLAVLPLERPTRVEITAEGPLETPHAMQRASKTMLLVPGRDVLGEGVILELNGFTVELLSPAAPAEGGPAPAQAAPPADPAGAQLAPPADLAPAQAARPDDPVPVEPGPVEVRARVTMLCGCPTEPGGMWDSDQIEIFARLLLDGEVMAETPLEYAGETSVYAGTLPDPGPGPAAVEVIAADPARANFGAVRRAIVVSDEALTHESERISRTDPPARPRSPRTRPWR